jgi:hypothetical protein
LVEKEIVSEFSRRARLLEGSGYIATEKFLIRLLQFLRNATALVDYGAGIGTISAFALESNDKLNIIAVEVDSWCRKEFTKNVLVPHSKSDIKLIEKLDEVDEKNLPQAAIWVIDVQQTSGDVTKILKTKFSSIWVEGHRFDQRREIIEIALSHCIGLRYTSFLGGRNSPKGGCYFRPSTFSTTRKMLMVIQSWRIKIIELLKLNIIEWELRSASAKIARHLRKLP